MSDRRGGQVLALFAIVLIGIIGMMALAIDVSSAYASRQDYRTAGDTAALAGAQDLQQPGTRAVAASDYANARTHAIASLEKHFGDTATCTQSGDRSDCTFSSQPYEFSIITPIPAGACATCDPARSVQVNVAHPTFGLTFSRILGFGTWRVAITSVAGLQHHKAYTIVTLRTPSSPAIPGVRDVAINGGTIVDVDRGDVGTNANMTYSGTNSILRLDPGYSMFYYDPFNGPLWGSDPAGTKIFDLILDPGYPVPSRANAPTAGVDTTGCAAIADGIYSNPNYAPSVPVAGGVPDMSLITCYTPGIYAPGSFGTGGSALSVSNGTLAILEPGLYFFDGPLDVQGSLIGGYEPDSEGVALVFVESAGTQFKNRTSGGSSSLEQVVALNAGNRFLNPGGREATAARDYNGGLVQTNTSPAKLMTLIVPPDPRCPVVFPFPATCTNTVENSNKAIDLSGGSRLYLAGVQYAPSDNVTISGNADTGGYVGQLWAWTLVYTGGSMINQEGDQQTQGGVLRLDAACTAPGTPCTP